MNKRLPGSLAAAVAAGVASTCALLALLSALPAAAQNAPTGPPGSNAGGVWEGMRDGNAIQEREANRLRDEELARQADKRHRTQGQALEENWRPLEGAQQLLGRQLQLPDGLALAAEHRSLAAAALRAQTERIAASWPAWLEQAKVHAVGTAKAQADPEAIALQLSTRVLNEAALWWADAEPQASDALWIEALKRESLCQAFAGPEPAAGLASLIEAMPADQRAAVWSGESARLARWGHAQRTVLPPADRTLDDSLAQALQNTQRARTLEQMPTPLRAAVQTPGWNQSQQPPAARCELLRWWSQEQVRRKQLSPRQAMLAWRGALAQRSSSALLAGVPRSGPEALDKDGFPKIAHQLELSGRVVVQQDVDAAGKVLSSFIQRRELLADGLGKLAPLALEHELDHVTLQRVAAMPAQAPEPSTLRDGVATRRIGIEWSRQ